MVDGSSKADWCLLLRIRNLERCGSSPKYGRVAPKSRAGGHWGVSSSVVGRELKACGLSPIVHVHQILPLHTHEDRVFGPVRETKTRP